MSLATARSSDSRRRKEGEAALLLARALPLARAASVLLTWESQLARTSTALGSDFAALRRHTERFFEAARKAKIT